MLVRTYVPSAPLSSHIDMFWHMEGYAPSHGKELTLPDGTVELVIDLRGSRNVLYDRYGRAIDLGAAIVCGPHSEPFAIDTSSGTSAIGIHFKPGGASPFLRAPLDELHNRHLDLELLWGAGANELRDELAEAGTPEARFRLLEARLLRRYDVRLAERHPAVSYALRLLDEPGEPLAIADLTGRIGMNPDRFLRLFKSEVGMTPKRYARLRRFQHVLGLLQAGGPADGAALAAACGYYDQSHFIKDFQAFAGRSPTGYRPAADRHPNHVVL
ncbi:AraC family transcriptional regulator [Paenibacillus flagellatus]|nr:helix-turn-helix domain-containing protein [Paenibacillus flagellatus]